MVGRSVLIRLDSSVIVDSFRARGRGGGRRGRVGSSRVAEGAGAVTVAVVVQKRCRGGRIIFEAVVVVEH